MPPITSQHLTIENLEVELLLSSKRRSLTIEVSPEQVKVRAPQRMKRSQIIEFVIQKKDWITHQKANFPTPAAALVLGDGSGVLFENQVLNLRVSAGRGKVQRTDQFLQVPIAKPKNDQHQQIISKLKAWYKTQAQQAFEEDINHFFQLMFETHELERLKLRVVVREYKKRWGCCATSHARGNKGHYQLKFNWRLMMAPVSVRQYVVIHELAHLREMNHSRAFWAIVENQLPNWREHKAWLDQYGSHLYRW